MCIAIYKPESMNLTELSLKNSWEHNPDGAGFMYAENEQLTVVKGLMSYDEFMTTFEPHKDKKAILHFRIATHGGINRENTHPFVVHDNLAMVHNGIISAVDTPDLSKSDTWHFNELFLKKFHPLWRDPQFKALVESYIGHSKLIMMNNLGEVEIYKEKLGYWDSQCWFSNKSYEESKPKYTSYSKPNPYNVPKTPDSLIVGDIVTLKYRQFFETPLNPNDGVWANPLDLATITHFGEGANIGLRLSTGHITTSQTWKVERFLPQEPKVLTSDDLFCDYWEVAEFYTKGQQLTLTRNFNHLRVGAIVITESTTPTQIIARDTITGRFLSIPKSSVRAYHPH
jgi:predicted glutamine amidotransferase